VFFNEEDGMRLRVLALLSVVAVVSGVTVASAQSTGEIYGKVTDTSGAVMPGVGVVLGGAALLQPLTAVTSESGTYRFPRLAIGLYTVKFELAGFKTVVKEGVRVEIGLNVQVNQSLDISTMQETVTVSGETPLVDLKDTGKTNRFTQEALQSIPSARDPWVIIEQSAGVAMDRQNVGGSASGQQSNFVARGAAMTQQKWNLDGSDITDMSATGGSPVYFDFDAFEEMQVSTGGADVTMQSPGVSVNLVTKSGTDKFKGSGRLYITDEKFQSQNVTDELRLQGASTGNPIQNIRDYGAEVGGPIKRGLAWWWGSYGKQKVDVGINGFYKSDANCQAMKTAMTANPLSYSLKDVKGCLNTDQTLLNNYNGKLALQLTTANQFSFFFNGAEKVRNARDASDLRPLETTYRQIGVTNDALGSKWWKTGMPKTYKWTDRHIFSDRFMIEASYTHVGNNFALTFHEDSLRDVQSQYDINTQAWARSYLESVYVRPTDSIDVIGNYFLTGVLGGDHAVKLGFKYRNDIAHSEVHYGGNTIARYSSLANLVGTQAQMYRDSLTEYELFNRSVYLQDSYTRKRMTVNAGIRFDYQTDEAHEASVVAHPFYNQPTYAGVYNNVTYTGAPFNQLPALTFGGHDSGGVAFKNFSPRLGMTFDVTGNGRNVIKANYARYVTQLGTGNLSSAYNTLAASYVRYPWMDLNGDQFVTPNEVVMTAVPLAYGGNYNYLTPTSPVSSGSNDPDLTSDVTDEFLVGFDKQIGSEFAVSASYIYRKYSNFYWSDTTGLSSSDYSAVPYTPTCTVTNARCGAVTYYQPNFAIPAAYVQTTRPDYWRNYNGFELTARKRMSHHYLVNASYSLNDAKVFYDSANAYEDPSNIENLNKGQFAPESTSSGIGNVFVNAKWIGRVSGVYQAPFGINVSAFYNARSGYPFIQSILSPSRANSAGTVSTYLDKLGDKRLPRFQTVDFRVDRVFTFAHRVRLTAGVDVFNLFNKNTTLSIRGQQNNSTANMISSILAPRVFRFGGRFTF
jgi:hypothetical protein